MQNGRATPVPEPDLSGATLLSPAANTARENKPLPEKKLSPMGRLVLYAKREPNNMTQGKIILPQGHEGTYHTTLGDVLAVGPKVEVVKAGDVIMTLGLEGRAYPAFYDGDELWAVAEENILCVVDNPPPRIPPKLATE